MLHNVIVIEDEMSPFYFLDYEEVNKIDGKEVEITENFKEEYREVMAKFWEIQDSLEQLYTGQREIA